MMNFTSEIESFVTRRAAIMAAQVESAGRKRAQERADELSREGLHAEAAIICNSAVRRLIELCYEPDTDGGYPANVDHVSGRVEIPIPWGRRYSEYGLRSGEAQVLRAHMLTLSAARLKALFFYHEATRRWFLNFDNYETLDAALQYWSVAEMTATQYRQYARKLRD